jgi:hypothetical protein
MEPPAFKVGDLVMIDARNLKTQRQSKKLDHKKIGPVKILKKIGTRAYRVELPPTIKVHNVFHVSLMEPYRTSKFPNLQKSPPPSEELEGETSWEVESVAVTGPDTQGPRTTDSSLITKSNFRSELRSQSRIQ